MVREHRIAELRDYFRYLSELDTQDQILFRGQKGDYPLRPRIARIKPRSSILDDEKHMMRALRRQSNQLLPRELLNSWEWLALAQHHGMATRLLDWTLNPLVALWFAVEKPPEKGQNGVVWVFKPAEADNVVDESDDPFAGKRTRVFTPSHVSARIRAQSGCFTVHKYLDASRGFSPLDRIKIYRKRLTKLIIPADSFCDLRFGLDRCGFNQFSIYPDIDGLCRHIEWQNSIMADEDSERSPRRLRVIKVRPRHRGV